MKKPVVATDISGVNEVVKHNKTGLLVPVKSPKKIAEAIKLIFSDSKLRNNLIDGAYAMIEKDFELNKQVKKVEGLFKKVHGKN